MWAVDRAAAGAAARAAMWAGSVEADVWANFDPYGLLERLIKIDNNAQEAAA
jgi:S-formylglutathione hydrolase FrmB